MSDAKRHGSSGTPGSGGKKERPPLQEFEVQTKDIRAQFADQIKCLEQRTETQLALLAEIQDFYRRRAEIELEHSKSLEKLTKQVLARHKAEKQKRESWPLHSSFGLWQELVESTRSDAKQRAIVADIYVNHVCAKLTNHGDDIQRISRKCREISIVAQQEISRVLNELHTALKTYQLCQHESCVVETKFRAAEGQKAKFEETYPQKVGNSRKHRFLEKEYEKRQVKYQEFKLRALKARNEYLLCINAANEALHKYYADDLSDMMDCMDLGMQQWVSALLSTIVSTREQLLSGENNSIGRIRSFADRLDSRADKQKFLEANHAMFMLPRKFEFRAHQSDEMRQVSAQKPVQEELIQRYMQMSARITDLKLETEEVWKTLETAEKRVLELQKQPVLSVTDLFTPSSSSSMTSSGLGSSGQSASQSATSSNSTGAPSVGVSTPGSAEKGSEKPKSCKEPELQIQKRRQDLAETEDFYLEKFQQYITNGNLIRRLTARHETLAKALGIRDPGAIQESMTSSFIAGQNGNAAHYESLQPHATSQVLVTAGLRRPNGIKLNRQDSASAGESDGVTTPGSDGAEGITRFAGPPSVPPKPRKKRIGVAGGSPNEKRPKLFGGSLEEYVEATGEEIPLVIRSCVRNLSVFALHHQGLFRVSGSQLEINKCKEAFEKGEDPWIELEDSNPDVNSVAGVLKLYFRELREPLFPIYMFDQFTDCAQIANKRDFVEKIKELIKTLPKPVFVVLRYLFAFLNHLSEFSDENMMDPYNLAVCFGPTLLPIPEGKDQVFFHNHVNEVMRNLIMLHEEVFDNDGGLVYQKYRWEEEPADDNLEEPDREGREDSNDPEAVRNRSQSIDVVSDDEDLRLREIARADWLKTKTDQLEQMNFRPIDDNSAPSSDTETSSTQVTPRENQVKKREITVTPVDNHAIRREKPVGKRENDGKRRENHVIKEENAIVSQREHHVNQSDSDSTPHSSDLTLRENHVTSFVSNEKEQTDVEVTVPQAPPLLMAEKCSHEDIWLKRASMQRAIREKPIEMSPPIKEGTEFRFHERMPVSNSGGEAGLSRREGRRHSERSSSNKTMTKSSCAALTSSEDYYPPTILANCNSPLTVSTNQRSAERTPTYYHRAEISPANSANKNRENVLSAYADRGYFSSSEQNRTPMVQSSLSSKFLGRQVSEGMDQYSGVDRSYYQDRGSVKFGGPGLGSLKEGDLMVSRAANRDKIGSKRLSLQTDVPSDLVLEELLGKSAQSTPVNQGKVAQMSPSSLNDIQTELKAVLNSLEHFTKSHQQMNADLSDEQDSTSQAKAAYEPDLVKNLPLTKSSPNQQASQNGGKVTFSPNSNHLDGGKAKSADSGAFTVKSYTTTASDGKQQAPPSNQEFGAIGIAAGVTGNIATAVGRVRAKSPPPGKRPMVPRKPAVPVLEEAKMAVESPTKDGTVREEKF